MQKYLVWLVLVCFGLAPGLRAQEQVYTLSLDQAREYALQNNKILLNARDEVKNVRYKVRENIAIGLPQMEGSLNYMTYFNYEVDFSMGSSNEDPPDINYALLDMGDIEVLNAISQMFGSSEPILMSDQLSGKFQLSQLVFSGQYIAGIQIARIARRMAEENLQLGELDVKENVTNTYFTILTTRHSLRILEENLQNLNAIMAHTQNMMNAGLMEQTDVDQVKITVNQVRNAQKSLERMNQLTYNMLKFQLGVPPETKIELTDSLQVLVDGLSPAAAVQLDFNMNQNLTHQLMTSQVEFNRKQLEMSKWAYAPNIVAFYNYTGKILSTGFDLNPNHLAGVTMNIPIFSSGTRRYQMAQAKVNLDIANRKLEIVEDQLKLQKDQLSFTYQNAWENYDIQKENVDVARRVYQSVRNKYEHGIASSLDLTQANSNYLNAESNYLSAVMTLLQAKTALDKLYNKL